MLGLDPDADRTETDAFPAHLHRSLPVSQGPDRRPPGRAACTQSYHLREKAEECLQCYSEEISFHISLTCSCLCSGLTPAQPVWFFVFTVT